MARRESGGHEKDLHPPVPKSHLLLCILVPNSHQFSGVQRISTRSHSKPSRWSIQTLPEFLQLIIDFLFHWKVSLVAIVKFPGLNP